MTDRRCTCHPDDNPPQPCPKKYALAECRAASKPEPAQEPCSSRVKRLCTANEWVEPTDDGPMYCIPESALPSLDYAAPLSDKAKQDRIMELHDKVLALASMAWGTPFFPVAAIEEARTALSQQQAEPDKMTDPVERARYWKLRALAAEGQVRAAPLSDTAKQDRIMELVVDAVAAALALGHCPVQRREEMRAWLSENHAALEAEVRKP